MKKLAAKLAVICLLAGALVTGYSAAAPAPARASGIVSLYQCPAYWPYLHVTWWGDVYCAAY
jgi:hypothetical protein